VRVCAVGALVMKKVNGEGILKALISKGFLSQVPKSELDVTIAQVQQVRDPRSISNIIFALRVDEFISESAPKIYKLNLSKVPEYAEQRTLSEVIEV